MQYQILSLSFLHQLPKFTTQKSVVWASFINLLSFFIYRPCVEHLSRQEYMLHEVFSNKWWYTSSNDHSQPSGVYLFTSNWLLFSLVWHKQEQDDKHVQQPPTCVHPHFHQPCLPNKWRIDDPNQNLPRPTPLSYNGHCWRLLHPTQGTPRNSTGGEILDPLRSSD